MILKLTKECHATYHPMVKAKRRRNYIMSGTFKHLLATKYMWRVILPWHFYRWGTWSSERLAHCSMSTCGGGGGGSSIDPHADNYNGWQLPLFWKIQGMALPDSLVSLPSNGISNSFILMLKPWIFLDFPEHIGVMWLFGLMVTVNVILGYVSE